MAPTTENFKYIYQLPFSERSEFCKIMNQNDKWEELAGKLPGNPNEVCICFINIRTLMATAFLLAIFIVIGNSLCNLSDTLCIEE